MNPVRPETGLRLVGDEEGGAPALEFTLVLPLYMLLIALFVETNLLLLSKSGTTVAAFMAARSAGVRLATDPWEAPAASRRAAVAALVPFASADPAHRTGPVSGPNAQFAVGVRSAWPYPEALVASRRAYAEVATTIEVHRDGQGATATVTYRHPVHTSAVGRLLGHRASWAPGPWVVEIRSTTTVPTASPANGLGIPYAPRY